MADQNDQQNPPAPQPAPQAPTPVVASTVQQAPTVVVQAETGLKSVIKDLWGKYGIFFVLIGILLLVAKFNDVIMDLLGWSSKKDLQKAEKTDVQLKAQEDAANQQADALVKKANDLPSQEGKVDENWNQKK